MIFIKEAMKHPLLASLRMSNHVVNESYKILNQNK